MNENSLTMTLSPGLPRPVVGDATPESLLAGLSKPRWAKMLARLLLPAVLFTPLALAFVPWQQNVVGSGRVIARDPLEREMRIEAPLEGRLERSLVTEGQSVVRGQAMFVLADNDPQLADNLRRQRADAEHRRDAASAQVDAETRRITELESALDFRLRSADLGITAAEQTVRSAGQSVLAAEASLTAATAARDTALIQYRRLAGLIEAAKAKGLPLPVSERDFELAVLQKDQGEAEVARATAALEAAGNTRTQAEASLGALKAERERVAGETRAGIEQARSSRESARSALAAARREVTDLDSRINRVSTLTVTAPRDGTVVRLLTGEGAYLKSGAPLCLLVPDTRKRTVELALDGNDIPLVARKLRESRQTGEPVHVRLQFEGWPAVQFAGWPQLAVGTFRGRVAVVDATDDGTGKFRVLVVEDHDGRDPIAEPDAWWPETEYLRQGVRVKGWVLLDQVPLGYELWRQLNGFPPVLSEPPRQGGKGDKADDGKESGPSGKPPLSRAAK